MTAAVTDLDTIERFEKGSHVDGVPAELACSQPGPDNLVCQKWRRHVTARHWAKGWDGRDVYWREERVTAQPIPWSQNRDHALCRS